MTKLAKYISISLVQIILLSGCVEQHQASKSNIISVSIPPLTSIVKAIIGDDFEVLTLVPAGASPETYEPTPKQFIDARNSILLFNTGLLDFEQKITSKIDDRESIIDLHQGVDLITGGCTHCSGSHNHAHGVDPHIWTSPVALEIIATNAFNAINSVYPDSIKYKYNYDSLIIKIKELNRYVSQKIKDSQLPYFIIYHPAFTYYARDYGIEQISIENEGKEPSAKRISTIIKDAREKGIKHIFYQSQFPVSAVQIVAEDIGAICVELDPMKVDVIANIKDITDLITAK